MGLLSGIAFISSLENEQEEKDIRKRIISIEKRIKRLEDKVLKEDKNGNEDAGSGSES